MFAHADIIQCTCFDMPLSENNESQRICKQ